MDYSNLSYSSDNKEVQNNTPSTKPLNPLIPALVGSLITILLVLGGFYSYTLGQQSGKKSVVENSSISSNAISSYSALSNSITSSITSSIISTSSVSSVSSSSTSNTTLTKFTSTKVPTFSFDYNPNAWKILSTDGPIKGGGIVQEVITLTKVNTGSTLVMNIENAGHGGLSGCLDSADQFINIGDGWNRVRLPNDTRIFTKYSITGLSAQDKASIVNGTSPLAGDDCSASSNYSLGLSAGRLENSFHADKFVLTLKNQDDRSIADDIIKSVKGLGV
jgi:hypothetical protein